ncbi:MAG: ATP-binding protein [Clostridiaceae bacterium]|nr:ATP-binding protein [Clostridiaceae bacterium]
MLINVQFLKRILVILIAPMVLLVMDGMLRPLSSDLTILAGSAVLLVVSLSLFLTTQLERASMALLSALSYGSVILFRKAVQRPPALSILFVIALIIMAGQLSGSLQQRIEKQKQLSTIESERRRLLGEVNTRLLAARGTEEIERQLLRAVFEITGHSSAYFIRSPSGRPVRTCSEPNGLILYEREKEVISTAFDIGQIVGVGTDRCLKSACRCYPIRFKGVVSAAVAILFGTEENDESLIQLTDQLLQRGAIALERQRLMDDQQEIITEKQVEEMRANFLRAISHDLRSPLAAITGACSALEQVSDSLPNNRRLLADIREEAEWLTNMVENLLSITRVSGDSPRLKLTAEAVEEIVGEAAYKCKTRFPQLVLAVTVPDQLILLQMDATLITQVILNLVENAVKYSGESPRVELNVTCEENNAVFSVRDHGDGIPEEKLGEIFDEKAPRSNDSHHGLGIGLSICQTIIHAHGGEIRAENCSDGGAKFSFSLPTEENGI